MPAQSFIPVTSFGLKCNVSLQIDIENNQGKSRKEKVAFKHLSMIKTIAKIPKVRESQPRELIIRELPITTVQFVECQPEGSRNALSKVGTLYVHVHQPNIFQSPYKKLDALCATLTKKSKCICK
jgi:hypothetical protein